MRRPIAAGMMRGLIAIITSEARGVAKENVKMTMDALDPTKLEQVTDKAIGYLSGAGISAMIYLGDRLGLYRAMRDAGRVTSQELATRTKLHERWVREWLHAQAGAGLVTYVGDRRYQLDPEQAAALADETSPAFVTGGFQLVMPLLAQQDRLDASFRTGRGVPYNALGEEHAVGESRFSGPWMRANLVPVILPALARVTDKLTRGAKVADIGCGSGLALVEMARAFPSSEFHGYDSAALAIERAKQHVATSGVRNVTLHHAPAASLPAGAGFDFVLTWDCLHDMVDPAGAMRAIRAAIATDGTWLIVDINGKGSPEENYAHPLGGLLYALSVLDCLACSTSEDHGAALGTLGLPEPVARRMTAEAGFTHFAPKDFGNPLNAFYEVRP
jgi:2-polyprenyl-3-methyl-5-hydroxy-6-metoxy-1,4-benzoquinol methylase